MKTCAMLFCISLLVAMPRVFAQDEIDRLYIKAHTAFDAGNYDLAIKCWSAVLKRDPKDATACFNRGVVYEWSGDTANAIADYTQALNLSPKDIATLMNRGELYYRTGAHEKAIADFSEIIGLKA